MVWFLLGENGNLKASKPAFSEVLLSDKNNQLFDAYYYTHGCGKSPYQRNQGWLDTFARIAERLIQDIHPTTVLDAGCALGFLVEGLRNQGVEAFGVDISEFAIEGVHDSIKPYCWQGSITEPFPRKYDLIVSIEVLEHMTKDQAEKAVANLCQHSEDILFSSSPFDYKEATHFNVQPPEYWAGLFARHGFYRDVDFDAAFITPWAARFRKSSEPVPRIIRAYERKHWLLLQDNHARRQLDIELRNELSTKEHELRYKYLDLQNRLEEVDGELQSILQSNSWRMLKQLQDFRERFIPLGSRREDAMHTLLRAVRILRKEGARGIFQRVSTRATWRLKVIRQGARYRLRGRAEAREIQVAPVLKRPEVSPHQANVEIVICVYNALEDVRRCLESVIQHTNLPYKLVLVDDGSGVETHNFLKQFARDNNCTLLQNAQAGGYTRAANRGLENTSGEFAVLLNSDTIVTRGWLDRMVACAQSNDQIGLVGPLSNTASWQSIPEIEFEGDWADNPLPTGISIDQMGDLVARSSARLYPEMTFLNGFCLLIRRELIQSIGVFDEENFGEGYGEENDYCLRARKAGWKLALADDTYIYHAQSRSYNHERRRRLSQRAGDVLSKKYGQHILDQGTAYLQNDRVFEGVRARSRQIFTRQGLLLQGKERFAGRRVLFVLPIRNAGGGSNIVMMEARTMQEMGVKVQVLNLRGHRASFEEAYPDLDLPVLYAEIDDIPRVAARYDAVVATFNPSVTWIAPAVTQKTDLIVGYYAQDFEPMFYPSDDPGYQRAWDSYNLVPGMVRFAKTEWTANEIESQIGVSCEVVGPSMDVDLFRPRPRAQEWPDRPLRIGAMIRPGSRYRAPKLTMQIFERLSRRYGSRVEFMIFGTEVNDPNFGELPHDFPWNLAGIIGPLKVANFLNELDVFVDFSSHQAMGLTAMEAMACGVAVIVPSVGGAAAFARHDENCLMVDTSNPEACWQALIRLLETHDLRTRLQKEALRDMPQYFPERSALEILKVLFGE